jgi:hypothetical protein
MRPESNAALRRNPAKDGQRQSARITSAWNKLGGLATPSSKPKTRAALNSPAAKLAAMSKSSLHESLPAFPPPPLSLGGPGRRAVSNFSSGLILLVGELCTSR